MTRIQPHERVRVETDLGDDVVGVRLLALQGVEKARIRYQRVTLRVATDAGPRQGMRHGRELVQQIAGVGVAARRRRGVAAHHERLTDAGGLEECHDTFELAAARDHARGQVRDDPEAAPGEVSAHVDRPLDAVLGRGRHGDGRALRQRPDLLLDPIHRDHLEARRGEKARRRRGLVRSCAICCRHDPPRCARIRILSILIYPAATPRLRLQARAAWARGDAVADDRTRRTAHGRFARHDDPRHRRGHRHGGRRGDQREAADRAELGGRRRGAGEHPLHRQHARGQRLRRVEPGGGSRRVRRITSGRRRLRRAR